MKLLTVTIRGDDALTIHRSASVGGGQISRPRAQSISPRPGSIPRASNTEVFPDAECPIKAIFCKALVRSVLRLPLITAEINSSPISQYSKSKAFLGSSVFRPDFLDHAGESQDGPFTDKDRAPDKNHAAGFMNDFTRCFHKITGINR